MSYRFEPRDQTRKTVIVLAIWWSAVGIGWIFLAVPWWVLAVMLAVTLPALWDVVRPGKSTLEISEYGILAVHRAQNIKVPRAGIDHVRLETRLDLSIRVRIVLRTAHRITLPPPCLPLLPELQDALHHHGYRTQRHHFSLA